MTDGAATFAHEVRAEYVEWDLTALGLASDAGLAKKGSLSVDPLQVFRVTERFAVEAVK